MLAAYARNGWVGFAPEAPVARWANAARPLARAALADPAQRAKGLVCEGTWFVGVDALPNDTTGAVDGVPLAGAVRGFADTLCGPLPLHPAQVSIIWPGYPRPRDGEGDAAFRYRQQREAAHVDGLLPIGAGRQRMLREPHAWILGIPLNEVSPCAAPLVLWQGSHRIMAYAFTTAFQGVARQSWTKLDVTEIYQAARRKVFETCPRVEVHAPVGGAYLLHRLTLHGVAAWDDTAEYSDEGRMIAYFRPLLPDITVWPNAD